MAVAQHPDEVPAIRVMPVRVDDRWLAVDVETIAEIVAGSEPAPMGILLGPAVGLIAWRGRAIAAIDLRRGRRPGIAPRIVVTRAGACLVGLEVDAVLEVRELDSSLVLLDVVALLAPLAS